MGYALDADELDQTCAQHPDAVCALISAACTIAAADAQIAVLTAAANLLADVHAGGDAATVMSLRQRLDRVADILTRALAQRGTAPRLPDTGDAAVAGSAPSGADISRAPRPTLGRRPPPTPVRLQLMRYGSMSHDP
ncbi:MULTISPECIES: hypothetical protein [unclassified Micromonospora]|uniref:hypothetical protein n=1 Tax=unclassified Micromonospora TaxID=2617518 RepID=UPI00368805FB|nr:hypothetical protein OG990_04860 [Micromonospora sp. NBC_00858]